MNPAKDLHANALTPDHMTSLNAKQHGLGDLVASVISSGAASWPAIFTYLVSNDLPALLAWLQSLQANPGAVPPG